MSHPFFHHARTLKGASNGMTLIEMLITIGILGLLVVIVSNIFISSNRFAQDEQIRIEVGESAGRLLGPLDGILREGKAVLATGVINGVTYTSDSDTLVFALPSIDGGGATIATVDDLAVVTFDTSVAVNPVLRLLVEPASATFRPSQNSVVLEHVKDLYFRYTADTITDAQALTLTVQTTKNLQTRSFTRSNILYAVFRNHP